MPFGNRARPTKVMRYGAKRPDVGQDDIYDQIRLALRFRNALVEQERTRREQADAILLGRMPELAGMREVAEQADDDLEAARAAIKAGNAASGRRRGGTVGPLKRARKEAWRAYRAARKEAFGDPMVRTELDQLDAENRETRKRLRHESGLHWGTYNQVIESLRDARKGAPPRFMARRDWNGRVSVQIQGGCTWEELLAGVGQARVEALPAAPGQRIGGRRSRRPWHRLWIRIGAHDIRGREPIWGGCRFALHRPIPGDGRIMAVHLVRRRVGRHDTWSVQFAVSRNAWEHADIHTAAGSAGIDLGWRVMDDGTMRVAYLQDDAGHEEELIIPGEMMERWRKCETLRSIRDREFAAVRDWLVAALHHADPPVSLLEATCSLRHWRAQARLAALVLWWRGERWAGDEALYERLDVWRRQDAHLYDWESHQRAACARWRQDHYRRWAARLRWRYVTVAVEDCDWRDLARTPPPEDHTEAEAANRRRWARIASPGRLREILSHGHPQVVSVKAAGTTRECHVCGAGPREGWDAAKQLVLECAAGHRTDQDRNAAIMLLRRLCERESGAEIPGGART